MSKSYTTLFIVALGTIPAIAFSSEGGSFGSESTAGLELPTMVADASEAMSDDKPAGDGEEVDNDEACAEYRADSCRQSKLTSAGRRRLCQLHSPVSSLLAHPDNA